ncbi:MAG TPA: hypothetical protein VM554_02590 [Acidisarcina sp.]|nr:hypothetical protein [Acidisarcina sp.]
MIAGLSSALALSIGIMQVHELPPLPEAIAGQLVGTVGDVMVVAGGSRWTAPPDQGGIKVFDDRILALSPDQTHWQQVARLPQPLAYGGAASLKHSLVLAGGLDDAKALRSVWALENQKKGYQLTRWPDLPTPMINFSMAIAGDRVYVFGGQESKDSPASAHLWSLALDADEHPTSSWHEEAPLPGDGRILAAAAGCRNQLYILGGASLAPSSEGTLTRHYVRQAWSFSPTNGWVRLPDLPAASVAAPAVCDAQNNVLLLGGDDGHMAGVVLKPGEKHPGFSHTVLRYNSITKTWDIAGQLPVGLVTTGAGVWKHGRIVIPGGEDRPGSRSNRVLELSFHK